MLSMTLTDNLRRFATQLIKLNSFVLASHRNMSSKDVVNESLKPYGDVEDAEEIAAREAAIEKKRNKSNLFTQDFNKQHDRPPYDEPIFEHLESLRYKRRMYGTYGEASKVDPSILWPSKTELAAMKEYEEVCQPFTIHQLIKKVQEAKENEAKERKDAEAALLKKVANIDSEIEAFHKRRAEQESKVQEVIAKRNKLIEKVRSHFGYKIDVRDERFKTMLAELEKEEKRQAKSAKKALKKAKLSAFLEASSKVEKSNADADADIDIDTIEDSVDEKEKISDDEDDTHPNIDTPSLFRWRHQARLERMEEMKNAREIHNQKKQDHKKKMQETKDKFEEAKKAGTNLDELTKALEELEKEAEDLRVKEEELTKKEKLTPWNVDTISKSGFSKTVFNTKPKPMKEELTEEEREEKMKKFIKEYEKEMKEFGMLQKYDDSKRYLQEHLQLVCEETANYLVIWCINLQMEDKGNLMEHVAHQCICMQYILELSKQLDVDPRACVGSFFSRIQTADVEYKQSFEDELIAFKERIRKRAQEKLDILIKEAEEEERKARLGPGGLDPLEVLESLPEELKKCFETQDIPLLQQTIANMPEDEARYHMKRCVDSGLWVPDGAKKNAEKADEDVSKE